MTATDPVEQWAVDLITPPPRRAVLIDDVSVAVPHDTCDRTT